MKKFKKKLRKITPEDKKIEDNIENCFITSEQGKGEINNPKSNEKNRIYPYNIDDIVIRLSVQNILSFAMGKTNYR